VTKQPSTQQKKAVFHNSLWYEIVYTFGVPRHDPTDYCHWEFINFTRMGHARVLYRFFETELSKRYQDDVLAEDFGFPASKIDLPEDDRRRLNKDLFHLTYSRLRHTPQSKPWPNSIISCLHDRCISFMEHIQREDQVFDDDRQRGAWSELLGALNSGRELLVECPAYSDGTVRYTLHPGAPLPNGKPVLTRLTPRSTSTDSEPESGLGSVNE